MNKRLLPIIIFMSAYGYTDSIGIIRTIPSDAISPIIFARHRFYNGPRNSVDNPAWNSFMNHKECAQWDELDYWCAIHEISNLQPDAEGDEFKNYFAGGYVFSILESVRMNMLQQWKLYDYPAFWRFLSSCPDYQECILSVYSIIQKDKSAYNQLSGQSYKMICSEYQKIKTQNEEKERIFNKQQDIKKEIMHKDSEDIPAVS